MRKASIILRVLFIIVSVGTLIAMMCSEALGDSVGYRYSGKSVVDDSCPVIESLRTKFGDYVVFDSGIVVTPLCGKYMVSVDFYNTTDQDTGFEWIKKERKQGWSYSTGIVFATIAVICIVGLIIIGAISTLDRKEQENK